MSSDINTVTLVGGLTRDPNIKELPSGSQVANLRLAVTGREKVDGDWCDRSNFFDIELFGGLATLAQSWLSKGRQVAVVGELRYREWQAVDGSNRNAVSVVAREIEFLGSASQGDRNAGDATRGHVAVSDAASAFGDDFDDADDGDDNPF